MKKTILITGSTDGIGLEAAKTLVAAGHQILLHGRNASKLKNVEDQLTALDGGGSVESYVADLSRLADVESFAKSVADKHQTLDVLINNAGILKAANTVTADGLDVRFAVNTIAPYILTKRLLPLLGSSSRVVNLSSAAQAPVNLKALAGEGTLSDMDAYSQSKLAITMWSRTLAESVGDSGPVVIALNPGSLLATKMVKEGMGIAGNDTRIGSGIIIKAALDDEFANATGQYFDNDSGQFAAPHPDALDTQKSQATVDAIESIVANVN